jgi:hypothetical protein
MIVCPSFASALTCPFRVDLAMRRMALALLALLVISLPAFGYSQDIDLESALRRSDPKALARFPANGHKNGAAGFFATHGLYVVPGSRTGLVSRPKSLRFETRLLRRILLPGQGAQTGNLSRRPLRPHWSMVPTARNEELCSYPRRNFLEGDSERRFRASGIPYL